MSRPTLPLSPTLPHVPPPDFANDRARKFKQAAFVYLHLGVLYEAAVWAAWRAGVITLGAGTVLSWLVAGAGIVAIVFCALWAKQWVWVARAVWLIGLFRLPALIRGAFFDGAVQLPAGFYLTALIVVLVNLVFMARAGWDL
jgi:hypothetical protein